MPTKPDLISLEDLEVHFTLAGGALSRLFGLGEHRYDALVDLLTERIGTDRVLVCARVDFVDDLTAGQIETAAALRGLMAGSVKG